MTKYNTSTIQYQTSAIWLFRPRGLPCARVVPSPRFVALATEIVRSIAALATGIVLSTVTLATRIVVTTPVLLFAPPILHDSLRTGDGRIGVRRLPSSVLKSEPHGLDGDACALGESTGVGPGESGEAFWLRHAAHWAFIVDLQES